MQEWNGEKIQLKNCFLYSKNKLRELRSNDILTLDIETTQMYKVYDKWRTYDYDIPEEDYTGCECLSFPYIWMFGFNDTVYYGRNWQELGLFLEMINDLNIKCICFIHNLSFEFVFLRNLFNVEKVFARKAHSIIYCYFKEIPNIEFRCSYYLTRLSLDDWSLKISEETGIEIRKKVGQLDYNIYRNEYTELTDEEIEYCLYDILVMYQGLKLYLKKYGDVFSIPLTQTGEIRKIVKKISRDCGFDKKATKLQPHTYEEYLRALMVTRGGDTHANYMYANTLLENLMCLDYISSYPFSMVTKKVPRGKFEKCGFNQLKDMAYILKLRLEGVKSKSVLHYISKHKCTLLPDRKKGEYVSYDNGKVINADFLEIWVTDLDYEIIMKNYDYDKRKVLECYGANMGYMPKAIIELILQQFVYKTSYKGVIGYEGIYLSAKQFINSIYPCMV